MEGKRIIKKTQKGRKNIHTLKKKYIKYMNFKTQPNPFILKAKY